MKYTLERRYDNEFGIDGFIVTERNGKRLNTQDFMSASEGRLLAHDIVEHWGGSEHGNLEELVALGSIFQHRQYDFYNQYSGAYSFPDEVAQQLYYYQNSMPNYIKHTKCSSEVIKDELDEIWPEIWAFFESNYDERPLDKRHLKMVAYRYLSKGYNHSAWMRNRYRIDLGYAYIALRGWFDRIMRDLVEYSWEGAEYSLNVNYGQRSASIKLTNEYGYDEEDFYAHEESTKW